MIHSCCGMYNSEEFSTHAHVFSSSELQILKSLYFKEWSSWIQICDACWEALHSCCMWLSLLSLLVSSYVVTLHEIEVEELFSVEILKLYIVAESFVVLWLIVLFIKRWCTALLYVQSLKLGHLCRAVVSLFFIREDRLVVSCPCVFVPLSQ